MKKVIMNEKMYADAECKFTPYYIYKERLDQRL